MINSLLNETATVRRRVSTGKDALNNPVYGSPTGGAGWNTVYQTMPCRLALFDEKISFDHVGERVRPVGTVYYMPNFAILAEDRLLMQDTQIEYVVISTRIAYKTGTVIDHLEAVIDLP